MNPGADRHTSILCNRDTNNNSTNNRLPSCCCRYGELTKRTLEQAVMENNRHVPSKNIDDFRCSEGRDKFYMCISVTGKSITLILFIFY